MATVANAAAVIAAVAIAILIYSAAAVLSSHTAAVLMNNITAVAVLQNTAAIVVLGYAVTAVVGDGFAAGDCAAAAGLPLSTFQPPGKVELSVEVTVPFVVDYAAVLTADTAADVRCAAAAASQTPDSI